VNPFRLRQLGGLPNGEYDTLSDARFCVRCLEVIPQVGVTRFVADDGKSVAGNVVIAAGVGGLFRLLTSPTGIVYVEINYVGDPTFPIRPIATDVPLSILQVVSYAVAGVSGSSDFAHPAGFMYPDERGAVSLVPCNVFLSNLEHDSLRINTTGSTVRLSIGGA
jgi:hypothetical protein